MLNPKRYIKINEIWDHFERDLISDAYFLKDTENKFLEL